MTWRRQRCCRPRPLSLLVLALAGPDGIKSLRRILQEAFAIRAGPPLPAAVSRLCVHKSDCQLGKGNEEFGVPRTLQLLKSSGAKRRGGGAILPQFQQTPRRLCKGRGDVVPGNTQHTLAHWKHASQPPLAVAHTGRASCAHSSARCPPKQLPRTCRQPASHCANPEAAATPMAPLPGGGGSEADTDDDRRWLAAMDAAARSTRGADGSARITASGEDASGKQASRRKVPLPVKVTPITPSSAPGRHTHVGAPPRPPGTGGRGL